MLSSKLAKRFLTSGKSWNQKCLFQQTGSRSVNSRGVATAKQFGVNSKGTSLTSSSKFTGIERIAPTKQQFASKAAADSTSLPAYLLNAPPTQITTLPNNLRVASETTHGEVATIAVWIDSGSANETKETNGVAHFLEHMSFKGTNKRSREQLEVEIENMGGSLNAYTSREQTVFYVKVFKNDVPKAVDILSDILLHSKFDKEAIESERGTILREMEEVHKDTGEVIFDHLHSAAFQGSSLGRTILGPEENIKSISRDNIVQYTKQNYLAPKIVLVGAGAVQHDQLVSLAEKSFASLPSGPGKTFMPKPKTPFTGSQISIRDDGMEEVHLVVAVEGVGASHPDYFTMMVIQTIVGNWERNIGGGKNLSSNLCELIANEELAHSFTSFNTCYSDTGLFGAYAICAPEKLEDITYEITQEWVRIAKLVTDSEVERAKSKLKASILMHLDGTTSIADDIGRQVLAHGRRLSAAETFLRINAISTKDVMRVASEHCEDVDPVIASVGPNSLLPDYNRIRGWTYWNRW